MEKKNVLSAKSLGIIAFVLALITSASFNVTAALIIAVFFLVLAFTEDGTDGKVTVLSALYLVLAGGLVRFVLARIFNIFFQIFQWADSYKAINVFNDISTCIGFVVTIAVALFAVVAIVNLIAGKAVKIPFVTEFAASTIGIVMPKAPKAPKAAPAAEGWTCECGKTNTGAFCANCGKPKQ